MLSLLMSIVVHVAQYVLAIVAVIFVCHILGLVRDLFIIRFKGETLKGLAVNVPLCLIVCATFYYLKW